MSSMPTVAAVTTFLRSKSWRAFQAYLLLCFVLSAAVGYYGGRVIAMKDMKPRVPTMLHFGEKDASIPVAGVQEVAALHPDVPVHIYAADHAFNRDHSANYDAPSAALAWTRTVEFFRQHLG